MAEAVQWRKAAVVQLKKSVISTTVIAREEAMVIEASGAEMTAGTRMCAELFETQCEVTQEANQTVKP